MRQVIVVNQRVIVTKQNGHKAVFDRALQIAEYSSKLKFKTEESQTSSHQKNILLRI